MRSCTIRKADACDIDEIVRIYDETHSAEEEGITTIGWIRDVYPVRTTAEDAVKRGDMFVQELDGQILGTAIINRIQVDVYHGAPWKHEAEADSIMVIHTLIISPSAKGRGLGRQFIEFYEDFARKNGCFELRLDTNEKNSAARAVYRSMGYEEIDIVPTVFNGIPGVNLVLIEKNLDFD